VKLLLFEPGSVWAHECWAEADEPYTSRMAYVEVRAALAAATRARRQTTTQLRDSKRRFESICSDINLVECDPRLIARAGDLAETSALRGYDAVHLATAKILDEADPILMLTWDDDLGDAAFEAGINGIRNGGS